MCGRGRETFVRHPATRAKLASKGEGPRGNHGFPRVKNSRIWGYFGDDSGAGWRSTPLLDSLVVDLERLIAVLGPAEVVGSADTAVGDLAYDARAARPGSLFFCVPGQRADGHDFAAEAVANGAVALVVQRRLDLPVPQLVVADSRAAMAVAADEFFGRPTEQLAVAGVTGTAGKTTTAFLLYAVLAAAGRRPGLLGTIETRVDGERRPATRTTAEAIDLQRLFREMLDAGDRSCAMEATSHGSRLQRLDRVRFAVLIFTNLSRDHLDFHRDMEDYFDAKRRLFIAEPIAPAAVNVGDPYGRRLADELRERGGRLITYGLVDDAEIRPDSADAAGSLEVGGLELHPRLRGHFNVENALAAVAAARLLGVADEAIARGVASVAGVPGRFETVDEGQEFTVVVDYAHKPGALETVLRTARGLASGRVVCVFGCGGDRDRGKRPIMGRIASELADVTIVTSDNPRSEDPLAIIDEVVAGMDGGQIVEPDRASAIEQAVELARPGDVVVIAGKGNERGQEIAGVVTPFDDAEVAGEALRALKTTA
jgi:UDP-N-acetylmuramoyl-L-alanyl-D-glutamate--2,6-diaminopimelate ligase